MVIDEYKNIHSNIDIIKETYNEIKRTSDDLNDRKNQITSILHSVNTMKDNFDTLTYEVFGKKDDEENIQEGLKDKLQKSFSSISNEMVNLKSDFEKLKTEQQNSFKE